MVAVANPLESFIWGAGGAQKTPEQVAREREIAAALMKGGVDYSPVDHWMQGAARAAQAGVGAFKDWRAGNAEQAGRDAFQGQWDSVFGGGGAAPTQTALIDPVAQALTATDAVNSVGGGSDFLNSLISNESGGDWAAQNDAVGSGGQVGHFGRLQFGQARLQDAMDAGVIPAGTTPEQFMADPAAQQAVEAWHFADIDKQAADLGLNKYIGQTIGGAQITPEAIRAMAHLGGIGGAQKFLESGGQYNPSDANGTSLLDYAQNHGGSGGGNMQVAQALGAGQPNMQQLMGLASDPWASDSQKSIINSLLGQQMQQQDPMYQMDMQLKQAQLAAANAGPGQDWQTIENGGDVYRWDANDPNSTPSMFFDGPDAAPTNDPFTLSPGQVRYGPDGQPVASVPETPEIPAGVDFDDTSGIRKEIQGLPSYKNYAQALPIYRSMVETAGRNSKASDLNLVYGLGKIMDPTSVVREGEMVMVQNTSALPDWLQGAINSLNGGSALSPETREAIMREAYGRVQGYDQAFQQDTGMYGGIAERNNINPADIIPDFGTYGIWSPPAPVGGPLTPTAEGMQPAPEGVDPAMWGVMTPEERALWQ